MAYMAYILALLQLGVEIWWRVAGLQEEHSRRGDAKQVSTRQALRQLDRLCWGTRSAGRFDKAVTVWEFLALLRVSLSQALIFLMILRVARLPASKLLVDLEMSLDGLASADHVVRKA
ncbi:unnamed protein product [Calypogeia fissa]